MIILNDASFLESVSDPWFWSKVASLAAFSTFVTRSWKFALHHWIQQKPSDRLINFSTIDKISMPIEGAILVARPFLLVGDLAAVTFLSSIGATGYYLLFKGDDLIRSWKKKNNISHWVPISTCQTLFH
ncbi:MAG: hypothetical protein R2827_11185 [Bdellovibrionales bacterium]